MIGLLIQDNAYEQDIRELLMSFYPGEVYAHEVKEGVDFYVESRLDGGQVRLLVWDEQDKSKETKETGESLRPAPAPGFALAMDRSRPAKTSRLAGSSSAADCI